MSHQVGIAEIPMGVWFQWPLDTRPSFRYIKVRDEAARAGGREITPANSGNWAYDKLAGCYVHFSDLTSFVIQPPNQPKTTQPKTTLPTECEWDIL